MKTYLFAAGALAALAAPGFCRADAPTPVDAVIVTGVRDPEDPPVVAEARQRLSRTPGAVSVISAESYSARQALALDDMLRDAPGVFAERKWGGDIRLSIRGSGLGNANHNRGLMIAQDGLPLNEADGYGDSQAVDPLIARYVEVWRGGNALRFGGALLGGAVNVATPTGETAGYRLRARIDGGSFGLLREHLAAAGTAGEWDGFAAVTNQTGQGERPQSQQNQQFVSLNLGRRFGEDQGVRLILGGADIRQEIPGALTLTQVRADPTQAAAGNLANDYGRNQRTLRGALQTRWRVGAALAVEAGAYAAWKDLDHPIFQVIDQQSRNYGLFARVDWDGEFAGHDADALAGFWLRRGDMDSNFYANRRGARGAAMSISLQNAQAADVFFEGRVFATETLALTAGGSWGRAERDYRSFAIPGVAAAIDLWAGKTWTWFAPRVGALWSPEPGVQAYANVTRSVEPPNFAALSPTGTGFAPVVPQEATTAEIGARGRRGAWLWDVTLYRAELDHELLQFAVSPQVPATTFNAGRTRHQGIEAAVDWRIASALRLRQTYAWSDFRFRGDRQYAGNRLPVIPEQLYRAELRYDAPGGWFVAPSVEWAPQGAWVDFRNTARAPGYAVWSLNAGVRVGRHANLFVDVRNLADETYVSNVQPVVAADASTAAYWPGDGRSVFAGLTLTY